MKNLFKLLGTVLVLFLSYSIYDYNYGDGEDWIHIADRAFPDTTPLIDFTVVPDGVPKFWEDGNPVEWNEMIHSSWINGHVKFLFRDNDSTKLQAILVTHPSFHKH
jgi:hypothetical protein